ncbi:YciI family protein [Actinomadura macrotermitis]|uniref:YCII-related domain-containing protein n=1 Tax=Actinomadura macrotermitis TaxID=2585200 RepID=A0A7K0BSZ9_9ACTN|nr:YciI family protein [Actinomadura macrotermitis]MQY04166.1 hypothetical protein [Actinomadura macrotermitis]
MRFMMMTSGDESSAQTPPDPQMMAEMGAFIEEMSKAGVLLATGGLEPGGTYVQATGGKMEVLDGPYAEAKEVVVGFALIEVSSREEAIELSRRFWAIVGEGKGVIQQVFGPED